MNSPIEVSIVIINYNTFNLTQDCINSVIKFTKGVNFEIILVENGTNEFTLDNVQQWGNKVKLIISPTNLGFAGGNNLGIKNCTGDYILLLNSDTYLIEDAISKSVQFIKSNQEIGVVSARLVYPDGRRQSVAQRFPSIKNNIIELLRLQKLMTKRFAGKILLGSFFGQNETAEVDWVWGAFFLIPRKVILQLPNKQLDDTYFMYWEDVQWCWDVKKIGYKIYFFSEAEVVHIHEGSKAAKNEMMNQNGILFFKRNYTTFALQFIKITNRWIGK